MQDFRELTVWKKAIALTKDCYVATRTLPSSERYSLLPQIRRSAVSIPSNIAEGCGRGTDKEFARFLQIAYGSACELETQALIDMHVTDVRPSDFTPIIDGSEELRRMLSALIGTLRRTDSNQAMSQGPKELKAESWAKADSWRKS